MGFPTGTVTFLFTDIESSTRLLQSIGEEAYAALLATHHDILRTALARNSGKEVDTQGDALFAVFPRAADAVSASVQAQNALAEHTRSGGMELRVRMGLHTGEAALGPTGYVGLDVHRASRISQVGHGGQILLSESTAALVKNELPSGVTLRDLGIHRLKDIAFPERISQLVMAGLDSEFPPLSSLDLVPNNLPVQLTAFVGRQKETAQLKNWLCPVQDGTAIGQAHATRLLTLTGTGGTGKTRLALEVAAHLLKEFPDGVWLCELATVADPALVPQAIASVLGVREQPGRSLLDSVADSLRSKHALLILDNCEHLIDAAAQTADRLLHAAPRIKILATSREALGVAGETAYRVPSLALPDAHTTLVEEVVNRESVQLFLLRASAVQPDFQLTAQNAGAVAQIVRRLDGIPLAIELAAARCKIFSAEQIVARLDDHFRLLTGGSRTALPRQQTLRALIDWSYDLLSPAECALLRRLSVFVGGCTYEAVEAVAGQDLDVLELLEHLVDKSLVMVEQHATSTRYRLLEMIRQYGLDKLRESGESASIRDRHLDYYANLVSSDMSFFYAASGLARFKQLRSEADNLRAAIAWGLEVKAEKVLDIVSGSGGYWRPAGLLAEGIDWVEQTIARFGLSASPDPGLSAGRVRARARVFLTFGNLQFDQGRSVPARAALQIAVELFRAIKDSVGLGASLGMLSLADLFLGNNDASLQESAEAEALAPKTGYAFARISMLTARSRITIALLHDLPMARRLLDEAVALAREESDPWLLAMPLMASGMVAFLQGDHARARNALLESMDIYREQQDAHRCNMVRSSLAGVLRAQGDLDGAARLYYEIIPNWLQMGQLGGIARSLECLGFVATTQAMQQERATRNMRLAVAAQLFGAAEQLRETSGAVMMPQEREEYDRETARLRALLPPEELTQAWERGRSLPLDQVIVLARAA